MKYIILVPGVRHNDLVFVPTVKRSPPAAQLPSITAQSYNSVHVCVCVHVRAVRGAFKTASASSFTMYGPELPTTVPPLPGPPRRLPAPQRDVRAFRSRSPISTTV